MAVFCAIWILPRAARPPTRRHFIRDELTAEVFETQMDVEMLMGIIVRQDKSWQGGCE